MNDLKELTYALLFAGCIALPFVLYFASMQP